MECDMARRWWEWALLKLTRATAASFPGGVGWAASSRPGRRAAMMAFCARTVPSAWASTEKAPASPLALRPVPAPPTEAPPLKPSSPLPSSSPPPSSSSSSSSLSSLAPPSPWALLPTRKRSPRPPGSSTRSHPTQESAAAEKAPPSPGSPSPPPSPEAAARPAERSLAMVERLRTCPRKRAAVNTFEAVQRTGGQLGLRGKRQRKKP